MNTPIKLLGTYDNDRASTLRNLIDTGCRQLPFTIANPLHQLYKEVAKENNQGSFTCILDTIEQSCKFLSAILFQMLFQHLGDNATQEENLVHAVNYVKENMSIGTWIGEIYSPLITAASKHCPNSPLVKSIWTYLFPLGKNLLRGNVNGSEDIANIRNKYKGHGVMVSEQIYRENAIWIEEYVLMPLLSAMQPLMQSEVCACVNGNRMNLNGINPQLTSCPMPDSKESHYYLILPSAEKPLDLTPFLYCTPNGTEYIFQTLKGKKMSYNSSALNVNENETADWNKLLNSIFQQAVPSFNVERKKMWDKILYDINELTSNFIKSATDSQKYRPDLFVDRQPLPNAYNDFMSPNNTITTLYPLIGDAGQGKTNQLCFWADPNYDKSKICSNICPDDALLLLPCADLFSTSDNSNNNKYHTLEDWLKKNICDITNLHDQACAGDEKHRVCFLFDAINECLTYNGDNETGPLSLFKDICNLLISETYTNFRVVITCRSYTWKNMILKGVEEEEDVKNKSRHIYSPSSATMVNMFTLDELEKAYKSYTNNDNEGSYSIDTPYDTLVKDYKEIIIRLRNPLVLKLACSINRCSDKDKHYHLSTNISDYTSLALFKNLYDNINAKDDGRKQIDILTNMSALILEHYDQEDPKDTISLKELDNNTTGTATNLKKRILSKDEVKLFTSSFINLEKDGLVRVNRTGHLDNWTIAFVYERFLEYALARYIIDTHKDLSKQYFIVQANKHHSKVVFMGVLRNVLLMSKKNDVLLELVKESSTNYHVLTLVSDTINTMVREKYDTVFEILHHLINDHPDNKADISTYNNLQKLIDTNKADEHIFKQYRDVKDSIVHTLQMRRLASSTLIKGIFLSDYYAEGLYSDNTPGDMLWQLLADPITDVHNDVCLNIYYLSRFTHTLEYSPISVNLTWELVRSMFDKIISIPLYSILYSVKRRRLLVQLLITSMQLCVLLIIRSEMHGQIAPNVTTDTIMDHVRTVVRHITLNYRLVRVVMPGLQAIMSTQLTRQSDYVNNISEYSRFWDENIIPKQAPSDQWSREAFTKVLGILKSFKESQQEHTNLEHPMFTELRKALRAAYHRGDSLSYFMLERLMVIIGTHNWSVIREFVIDFFSDNYRQDPWFDYSQMSMLYVLYQISVQSNHYNKELLDIYARESVDWTLRCKGLYKARNSKRANKNGLYKRNVMNWYCVVSIQQMSHLPEATMQSNTFPAFRELINQTFDTIHEGKVDYKLISHLLDNISELTSDNEYIHKNIQPVLDLLWRLITKIDDLLVKTGYSDKEQKDQEQEELLAQVGRVLSTAKNYFPTEVDAFIRSRLTNIQTSALSRFKEEILSYTPSQESLSDLLTHQFGNFLIQSLIND